MLWKSICDNLGTIIGVFGSLFGVVLGWILNEVARKGKLIVNIRGNIKGDFYARNELVAKSLDDSNQFKCKINLEISNSGTDRKVMKDIRIAFCDETKENIKLEADFLLGKDSLMAVERSSAIMHIPAKTASSIIFIVSTEKKEEILKIHKTSKIFLLFKNEKNKEKKKLILRGEVFRDYQFCQW